MKKGILFDLDGTLWDSAQALADSWNEQGTDVYIYGTYHGGYCD